MFNKNMLNKNILVFDTSTPQCVVALSANNKIYSRSNHEMRQHARVIFDLIASVLHEAAIEKNQLDIIAFGCGPGSFTGLRVAASVAQSLAFALAKPVVPISTLQLMAQSARMETAANNILVTMDARMQEIYWAQFVASDNSPVVALNGSEHLSPEAAIELPQVENWIVVGSALQQFPQFNLRCEQQPNCVARHADQLLHPAAMLLLAAERWQSGAAVAAQDALPVYLRDEVVKV